MDEHAPPRATRPALRAEGLAHDLRMMKARRRRTLAWLGGLAAWPLVGCGGGGDDDGGDAISDTGGDSLGTDDGSSGTDTCSVINSETAGPYPGDGTNTNSSGIVNALLLDGVVRPDIRTSVGGAGGTAPGIPLTVTLKLVDASSSCTSLAGHAVYLWHCTRDGQYSLYSSSVADEDYLRGVQVTDANGEVTFTTIFPGCYSGRWPHMHFEVFASLAQATSGANDLKTSQLALPTAACNEVYAGADGYASSLANFRAISLASDNVFRDDSAAHQLATVTGDLAGGYAATLTVGIAA